MTEEYRFLRFEIVGITTILYTLLILLPLIFTGLKDFLAKDMSAALAFVGSLFVFSIPIGYIMHQLVVNKYRSEKKPTEIFSILDKYVNKIIRDIKEEKQKEKIKKSYDDLDARQKNSFLTALLDVILHMKQDEYGDVYDRIEVRWSHFYARKSVGKYAPLAAIPFGILSALILSYTTKWIIFEPQKLVISVIFSAFIWLVLFIFSLFFIDSYSKKIMLEIEYLEKIVFISKKKEADELTTNVLSEYF
jgi:hypothetical protein